MKPYRFWDDILHDWIYLTCVRPFEKYPELVPLFSGILMWFYADTFTHENGVLVFKCFSFLFFIMMLIVFVLRKIK